MSAQVAHRRRGYAISPAFEADPHKMAQSYLLPVVQTITSDFCSGEFDVRLNTLRTAVTSLLAATLSFGVDLDQAKAQDLPTDAQIQAAFGVAYNHLGLLQYCATRKFVTVADVANSREVLDATVAGMNVSSAARAQQEVGQHGTIIGRQLIGLMDARNPAHPEMVPEGQTMSLADNAKAQHTSERALCRQMAAQAVPLR